MSQIEERLRALGLSLPEPKGTVANCLRPGNPAAQLPFGAAPQLDRILRLSSCPHAHRCRRRFSSALIRHKLGVRVIAECHQ